MSTAVADRPQQLTIRDRLKNPAMISELGKAMPVHCRPERMARVALTAITRTPLLAECDEASFFQCLLTLSQWGLEPDGRRAHLIPFRNTKRECIECQLIIDYKGLVELAYRSGIVRNIHADVVRDGDIFEFDRGQVTKHTPWFLRRDADKPSEQGEVFAVYCLVELTGGTAKCEVLPKLDVEKIRRRSRAGNNGPWVTDWEEMAKKTAFRRVSKWLPLSADIQDAFDKDADKFDPITVEAAPKSGPVALESLEQMLSKSSYEPGQPEAEQPSGDAETPKTDAPKSEPKQEPTGEWESFTKEVDSAKQVGDVKALRKKYATAFTDRMEEFLRLCDEAEHSIHEARKSGGKKDKGELFEKAPNAQAEGV